MAAERLGGLITLKTFLEFARAVRLVCLSLVQCSVSLRNGCEDVCNFKLSPPPSPPPPERQCVESMCVHTHTHTRKCTAPIGGRTEARVGFMGLENGCHRMPSAPNRRIYVHTSTHARTRLAVRPSVRLAKSFRGQPQEHTFAFTGVSARAS